MIPVREHCGEPGKQPVEPTGAGEQCIDEQVLSAAGAAAVCLPTEGWAPAHRGTEVDIGQLSPHWWRIGCPRGKLAPSAADPGKARGKGLGHTLGGGDSLAICRWQALIWASGLTSVALSIFPADSGGGRSSAGCPLHKAQEPGRPRTPRREPGLGRVRPGLPGHRRL